AARTLRRLGAIHRNRRPGLQRRGRGVPIAEQHLGGAVPALVLQELAGLRPADRNALPICRRSSRRFFPPDAHPLGKGRRAADIPPDALSLFTAAGCHLFVRIRFALGAGGWLAGKPWHFAREGLPGRSARTAE